MPISSASTNSRVVTPPNSTSALSVKITVSDVLQRAAERLGQAVVDDLLERLRRACGGMFSRMRSNTTIVSWTEKPITVSTAVTNSESTSTLEQRARGSRRCRARPARRAAAR